MVSSGSHALLVATDRYADPTLRQLRAPQADAEALAEVLRDPAIGGYAVRTLRNEPSHVINLAIEDFFADRHRDELLLLYFSGHGIKDDSGRLYLATMDSRHNRLGATAISSRFVREQMDSSRSRRVVVILDCCYAGAFPQGLVHRAPPLVNIGATLGGRGSAVLT